MAEKITKMNENVPNISTRKKKKLVPQFHTGQTMSQKKFSHFQGDAGRTLVFEVDKNTLTPVVGAKYLPNLYEETNSQDLETSGINKKGYPHARQLLNVCSPTFYQNTMQVQFLEIMPNSP